MIHEYWPPVDRHTHLSCGQLEEIFRCFRDSLSKESNDYPSCILISDPDVKVHLGKQPNPESHIKHQFCRCITVL